MITDVKQKYDVVRQILKISNLRKNISDMMANIIAVQNSQENIFRMYFYLYATETSQIVKDMLACEKIYLRDISAIVRANDSIYYLAFQDMGRFCENLEMLLTDIRWLTADEDYPLYCYGWTNMLILLENILPNSEGYFNGEAYRHLEKTVIELEKRATEQGLKR